MAFLYDLPHTVARLRQGDPALAGYDTDGLSGVRPNDAQQWQIDPAAGHLPQAEVHQALLARAVEWLCPWPLPRLWYLPGEAQALLVLTGDLCSDRPDAWLVDEAALAERHGGTMTFYLHERASLDPQTAAGLRQRGHSLSIHPFAEPFSAPTMDETLGRHLTAFEARFGGRPRTVRHHRLQWLGWAEQAALEHRHGLAMDLNFTTARPLRNGFHFGAGRPLPFVAETGEVLPVWQQPTHFEDDLLLGGHEISLGIDTREACALYDDLLDGARRRWHTVLAVNVHPGNYAGYSGDWGRHLVAQTAAQGVPIWDAERWLRFTRARAAVCPRRPLPLPGGGPAGAGPGWRIDVPRGTDEAGLMLLLPLRFAGQELRFRRTARNWTSSGGATGEWRCGAPRPRSTPCTPRKAGRKAGPSGADSPPAARPPPGPPRAPPSAPPPSRRASPAARPRDGTFAGWTAATVLPCGLSRSRAAGHAAGGPASWRARAAPPPRGLRPAPPRPRAPRRPRRGARRPPSRRRAVRSHRRRSAAGGTCFRTPRRRGRGPNASSWSGSAATGLSRMASSRASVAGTSTCS